MCRIRRRYDNNSSTKSPIKVFIGGDPVKKQIPTATYETSKPVSVVVDEEKGTVVIAEGI